MFHIQEKKVIILISSVVLVFLLIGGLIIYPQYFKIKETNNQITELRQQLETKYERAKQYHKSQTNLAAAKKLSESLNSRFLKKGEEIKLITLLEGKADNLNLKQQLNLNSTYAPLTNNLYSIDLEISVAGDYKKVMDFINWLQRNTFYLSINQVTITKSVPPTLVQDKTKTTPATPPPALVTCNLKTAVYVQD